MNVSRSERAMSQFGIDPIAECTDGHKFGFSHYASTIINNYSLIGAGVARRGRYLFNGASTPHGVFNARDLEMHIRSPIASTSPPFRPFEESI